jgi:hypothetical protein
VGLADIAVERFEVKVELPDVRGLEGGDFQLDGNESVQASMKKQQINRAVARSHLNGIFLTDEAKITAQLAQKVPKAMHQGPSQIGLGVGNRQAKKLHYVAILEVARGLFGENSRQRRDFFWSGAPGSIKLSHPPQI